MATCGYVCPRCEGSGFSDEGKPCDWCTPKTPKTLEKKNDIVSEEEWMREVHEGKCCGDE